MNFEARELQGILERIHRLEVQNRRLDGAISLPSHCFLLFF
jgi:hypothetical protein